MKVTVFTSNSSRHTSLVEALADICDEIFVVTESVTVVPGQVEDLYRRSAVMEDYFRRVIEAEQMVFGRPRFLPQQARVLPIRLDDLNRLDLGDLAPALRSDAYIVFGASYIKPPLVDALTERSAVNVHMGVSPYYRGSSCNFWALSDGHPELVGATIHRLTRGLDSGPIMLHALPAAARYEPFRLGMEAVRAAHLALVDHLARDTLMSLEVIDQDRSKEIRYARTADFTDEVATEYLSRALSPEVVYERLATRRPEDYWNPFVAAASAEGAS
jgi:hypothetical protein